MTPQMPDYKTLFMRLWELACTDDPQRRPSCQVVDGHFVLTITGNRDHWVAMTDDCGVPADAQQSVAGDTLTYRWVSHADAIFGEGGMLAQRLPGYEVRRPQLHMARLVQRALEMQAPAVVEAGTGTGKSYAYAAICMAMNEPVVISTSNKALQMQLAQKDIPFLQTLFPDKTLAVAVGKRNYACRLKVEGPERQNTGPQDPALHDWYLTTASGNTEEIPTAVDWRTLQAITLDDDCAGKHCPLYDDCFYYQAKRERRDADVIICNHNLLALAQLYPTGGILPTDAVIVVDEAHKLPAVVRDTIGVELAQPAIDRGIAQADGWAPPTMLQETQSTSLLFARELGDFLRDKEGQQIGLNGTEFVTGVTLAKQLHTLACAVFEPGEFAMDAEEAKQEKVATRLTALAAKVNAIAKPTDLVRWLEPMRRDEPLTMCAKPHSVRDFIANLAGIETVTPVTPVAPYADGDEGEAQPDQRTTTRAIIFCSATLAAPDLSAFMRECGLPDALRLIAASPFDYAQQALLYAPVGTAPAPNEPGWLAWLCDELNTLVLSAKGGAFLLFTSHSAMQKAAEALRETFYRRGLLVLMQGDYPKLELARRFAADGNAVLFATKSFFEGVDIQGEALRLVVVDKLPFEAPSPLGEAMETALTAQGKPAFDALRLPNMIIELKQATGRLIRTQHDTGVIAIMDSRLRSHRYGRTKVLPALPPAKVVGRLAAVEAFFMERQPAVTAADLNWEAVAQRREERQLTALNLSMNAVEEMPF